MLRLVLLTPVYLITFLAMHTFLLNIVQAVHLVHFLTRFELKIWGRMYGQSNPIETHHNFKSMTSNTDYAHTNRVKEHGIRLHEIKKLYGAGSKQYRGALEKVHEQVDSDNEDEGEDEDEGNESEASISATQVVPASHMTKCIRKVVTVKVLDGPHKGHVVHKQFRYPDKYSMSFGTDPNECDVVFHMDEHISGKRSEAKPGEKKKKKKKRTNKSTRGV